MLNKNLEGFELRDAQNDIIALILFLQSGGHKRVSNEGDHLISLLSFHISGPHKDALAGVLSEAFMTATNPKNKASLYCVEVKTLLSGFGFIDHFARHPALKLRSIYTDPHAMSADKLTLPSIPSDWQKAPLPLDNVRPLKPRRPSTIRQDQDSTPYPVAARR